MNMSYIDLGIIGAYLVITLAVGLYYGRKTDSFKDFAVGDRNLGAFALFATMFATMAGGFSTMGISEKVFSVGFVFVFVCTGASVYNHRGIFHFWENGELHKKIHINRRHCELFLW